jgi:hypothetical protein
MSFMLAQPGAPPSYYSPDELKMYFVPPAAQKARQSRLQQKTRRLWLHAGLHKTGTTSLQSFLVQERGALADLGILYVKAGSNQYLDGQHNLAWQLTGDRRFELDTATLPEAIEEIADFDGDAILSSEDFETLLHRPAALDPLLRHPLLRRHQVSVLVYLRHQPAYLAALVAESHKHGEQLDPEACVEEILRTGRLRSREWEFQFDWLAMARAWPYRGARLVPRNYHALRGGSIIADAMAQLAPALPLEQDVRLNPDHAEPLPEALALRLAAHFAPLNRRICAKAGIDSTGLV